MRWMMAGVIGALLLSAGFGSAAGGLAVNGAGLGTSWASDGTGACNGHPAVVNIVYLPNSAAILHFYYRGAVACPLETGGVAYGGVLTWTVLPPSASLTFSCNGSEASGLYCIGADSQAWVSAYQGAGNPMTLLKVGGNPNIGTNRVFALSFLAV